MGLPGLTAECGRPLAKSPVAMGLCVCPPDSLGPVWVLVQSGLGRFPVASEGFNAVLGQLARWFYPFGSGAHCNNYFYCECCYKRGRGHIWPMHPNLWRPGRAAGTCLCPSRVTAGCTVLGRLRGISACTVVWPPREQWGYVLSGHGFCSISSNVRGGG